MKLFICNIEKSITKFRLWNIIKKLNWGEIKNIKIKEGKNDINYAFINLNEINKKKLDVFQYMIDDNSVKIIYDFPKYLKCCICKNN